MRLLMLSTLLLFSVPAFAQGPKAHPDFEPTLPHAQKSVSNNLFSNAKMTASGDMKGFEAHIANDGVFNNSGKHWGAENLPVWLKAEMPNIEELSCIRIWPYWGDGRVYTYTIEGSLDGEKWFMLVDNSANSITTSSEGVIHTFNPQKTKFVRVNVLSNSAGAKKGGHIVEIQGFKDKKSGKLAYMAGNIDQRYLKDANISQSAGVEKVDLTAWRGERVNAQFLFKPASTGKTLRIYGVEKMQDDAINVDPNFVRFVRASNKLQPDVLEDLKAVPTEEDAVRSMWVTINVPQDAKPGMHKYIVKVGENLKDAVKCEINLQVVNAVLPAPQDWKIRLDLWQTPESVARVHKVKPWSDEHFAILRPHMKLLADAGQKNITTTIMYEAWNQQSFDYLPGMVKWIKKADGKMTYDFTIFDKWVEFATNEIGLKGPISCYTLIPWSLKFRYYDEAKGEDVDVSLHPSSKEYEMFWGDFLEVFSKHLKEKGWMDRAYIGMDERPDALMIPTLEVIKKYAPDIKITSAVDRATDKTYNIVELSPAIGEVDKSKKVLAERKKRGLFSTFYVCTNPARPNTFTHSPLSESEWLGNYAAANHLDGFLRWAYDNYVENPLECTDYVKWPSGDCFLVYPGGRSSLRFERLRDGFENFEKINILREKAKTTQQEAVIAPLEEYLTKTYTWSRGQRADTPTAKDNEELQKLINQTAENLLK